MFNSRAILSSTPCDSHMWNLIYMELFLKEHHFDVINLGCCVPDTDLVQHILDHQPSLVVISSINGYLYRELLNTIPIIHGLRSTLKNPFKLVAGGKLTVDDGDINSLSDNLIKMGLDRLFIGGDSLMRFSAYLAGFGANRYKLAG